MLALPPQEQARVEENMGPAGMVLSTCVHTPAPGSVYTMEDLYQIGCVGLCKGVQTDKTSHSAAFSTYASWLIRNEIYDALVYSTRHGNREHVLEHSMSERDAFILILRYLHNMSLREIAAYYGLSYGCIRQIIKKALRRLRHPSHRKYLLDGCAKVEQKAAAALEGQANFKPPADPKPRTAIAEIADPHIRIDVIMARGGLNQIAWLDLPVRAYNCLASRQVKNVWQLCALTPATLLRFRNLGAGTLTVLKLGIMPSSNMRLWRQITDNQAAMNKKGIPNGLVPKGIPSFLRIGEVSFYSSVTAAT